MRLEILHRPPTGESKGHVVLVHGACMAAWCWEDNYLPWFAAHGYDTHAVSLRNHGGSERTATPRFTSVRAYAEDLAGTVERLQGPVHLIGHSMGGLTIQHYLAGNPPEKVRRAVLLCSTVPHTDLSVVGRLLRDFPLPFLEANLRLSWRPVFRDPGRARRVMLSPGFPESGLKAILARMQDESFLAFLQILGLGRPDTSRVRVPLMVIGGGEDYLITEKATRRMAATYGVEPHIVAGGPHNLMMSEGWEREAGRILAFFDSE